MATPQTHAPEGWELQFATNHFGHIHLANGLRSYLAAASGVRVMSASSAGHLDSPAVFADIHFHECTYDPWNEYRQSKTANVLFAVEAISVGPTTMSGSTPCTPAASGPI